MTDEYKLSLLSSYKLTGFCSFIDVIACHRRTTMEVSLINREELYYLAYN
jgi:hypothetical protein